MAVRDLTDFKLRWRETLAEIPQDPSVCAALERWRAENNLPKTLPQETAATSIRNCDPGPSTNGDVPQEQ
jgi:hypothetical protein